MLLVDMLGEPAVTAPRAMASTAIRRLLSLPRDHWLRTLARETYRRLPWISPDVVVGTQVASRPIAGEHGATEPLHRFLTRQGAFIK